MANIEFRGMARDGGWVYGSLLVDENGDCIIIPIDYDAYTHDGALCIETWTKVQPETVGQFTGHVSKNDRKIFTGDILLDELTKRRLFVIFDSERNCFCMAEHLGKNAQTYGLDCRIRRMNGQLDYPVVGNVHENPEMI